MFYDERKLKKYFKLLVKIIELSQHKPEYVPFNNEVEFII